MRARGHAPYVLGRKALLAQGSACHACSSALLSGGSSPNARPQMHRKQKPGTRTHQCHAHPGPVFQPCHPAFVTSGSFQPGSGKRGGESGSRSDVSCMRRTHTGYVKPKSPSLPARVKSYVPAHLGWLLTMGTEQRTACPEPTSLTHSFLRSINQYLPSIYYVSGLCSALVTQK